LVSEAIGCCRGEESIPDDALGDVFFCWEWYGYLRNRTLLSTTQARDRWSTKDSGALGCAGWLGLTPQVRLDY